VATTSAEIRATGRAFATFNAAFKVENHNGSLLGLHYASNAAPAIAAAAPAAACPFQDFFDWCDADLTDRARQIIMKLSLPVLLGSFALRSMVSQIVPALLITICSFRSAAPTLWTPNSSPVACRRMKLSLAVLGKKTNSRQPPKAFVNHKIVAWKSSCFDLGGRRPGKRRGAVRRPCFVM